MQPSLHSQSMVTINRYDGVTMENEKFVRSSAGKTLSIAPPICRVTRSAPHIRLKRASFTHESLAAARSRNFDGLRRFELDRASVT